MCCVRANISVLRQDRESRPLACVETFYPSRLCILGDTSDAALYEKMHSRSYDELDLRGFA